jgi:SNF2 family DNA or RNA helicase
MGLHWSENATAWIRLLDSETDGDPNDRAAELASRLVNAGVSVDVPDPVALSVQSGSWEAAYVRWVKVVGGKFAIHWWKRQDENLYSRAKTLPESQYDPISKSVLVPPLYWMEVEGFAGEHDFQFSKDAAALLDQSRRSFSRMILPSAPAPTACKQKKKTLHTYNLADFADIPRRSINTITDLLPHQVPAVDKLEPFVVGALFMDMGTGKTRCAIELAVRRQARISKVIWFCPVSLKLTIATEIEKHSSGELVHVFDDETSIETMPDAFWYIVGIESMSSSDRVVLAVNDLIDLDTFAIVDESSYIKGHASKRSVRISELCKRARYRLILTGTPISQGVEDLYAQMRFLSPEILGYGSFYSFARNHLEFSEKYPGLIVRTHNVPELAKKINPFVYQITKAEALDLPEKLYDSVYCSLSDEQRDAYERAKNEILMDIDYDRLDSYVIFRLFTALQQVASGFRTVGQKLETYQHNRLTTLLDVIAGIPDDEKIVIWCKYLYSLHQIAEALPGSALYYGDLNEQQRQAEIDRFRSSARFLVATQATGGHGLTLNEARYVIFYENEFKYSNRVQAEDRCHRIGQARNVTYIDVISTAGIDDRIQTALARKADAVKMFRSELKKNKELAKKL